LVMSEKDTLRGKSSSLCEANPQAARIPEVEELVVSKELVYQSLEAEVLERLPLASR
jgi:hypothetical protein